jgi:hypothetical protein
MQKFHKKTIYETLGRESVHPFPARMAPGIALEIISKAKRPLRILDPMVGSGTVIALARLKGHRTVGIDIDPLAVLISKVWATVADAKGSARESKGSSRPCEEDFCGYPAGPSISSGFRSGDA